jgi:hypothetical protein
VLLAPEHRAQVVCDHHATHVVSQQRKHVHAKHNLQQQQHGGSSGGGGGDSKRMSTTLTLAASL